MKKVITFGVFDYFHLGHLYLFEKAKGYGDYLIVAIHADEAILKYKPSACMLYSTEQRAHMVKALSVVDEVGTYNDVDIDIQKFDFDVFAIGEEQNHAGFQRAVDWCEKHGKEVVRLPRTKGISSTEIKQKIKNNLT